MAHVINDRVKETSTSTGTGTINLDGAVSGFETFVAGIGNSNTTYYCIAHQTAAEFGADKSSSSGDFQVVFPTADASNVIIRIA